MNCKTIAALLVASAFAAAPAWLSAQDKTTTPAKSAAPAKAAATAKPATPAKAATPAKTEAAVDAKPAAKPGATAEGADGAWKELQAVQPPAFDASKRQDQEYVQKYMAQMQESIKKRGEMAKAFLEKYPSDPHKADALYIRAETIARTGGDKAEFATVAEDFIKAAPTDERGQMLLFTAAQMQEDETKQTAMLRDFVKRYPTGRFADQANGALKLADAVGKPFEYPTFKDAINGNEMSAKALKGKVVVVDFWATWCGPCVAEMPKMKELYAKYKDQGVEFLGISLDQPESEGGLTKLKEFCAQNQITWPQYYQGKGWESDFSRGWGINSIPRVFVVGADGNLHSTQGRGKLEEMLPELLKKAGKKEVSGTALPF
jgi:thiol-disulfide isomerase/thioredoxin